MLLLRLFVQEIEDLLPGSLSFRISESCLQFRSKDLHLVILEQFPQEVRSIEEKSLEEESETTSIKLWVIFFVSVHSVRHVSSVQYLEVSLKYKWPHSTGREK